MAKKKQTEFGIAMRNFTKYPEMPSAQALIDYGVRMEELGYESIWAWDHILLGVEPNFPIHEALAILTAVAARTSKIKIGTGILVHADAQSGASWPRSSPPSTTSPTAG